MAGLFDVDTDEQRRQRNRAMVGRVGQQAGLLGLGFVPGAGMADYLGQFPSVDGGQEPSAVQNFRDGNYGTAAMQLLGAGGDAMYAMPLLGATVGNALKAPRALQKAVSSMSKEQFLGTPKIVSAQNSKSLQPKLLPANEKAVSEPFMGGKYELKMSEDGAAVLDKDKVVASYNFGDTLVVDPSYRKQGIGEELVYEYRTRFPSEAKATTRTQKSQDIQERVWNRIQSDQAAPEAGLLGSPAESPSPGLLPSADDIDYRGSHSAPNAEVYGATLDRLEGIMPADVYSSKGLNLYGLGDRTVDAEWYRAAKKAQGNPDAPIEVYRAVPKGVKNINDGDWVTTSRKYAKMHGDNTLDGSFEIIKEVVPARSLSSEGYPYEFGYRRPK